MLGINLFTSSMLGLALRQTKWNFRFSARNFPAHLFYIYLYIWYNKIWIKNTKWHDQLKNHQKTQNISFFFSFNGFLFYFCITIGFNFLYFFRPPKSQYRPTIYLVLYCWEEFFQFLCVFFKKNKRCQKRKKKKNRKWLWWRWRRS